MPALSFLAVALAFLLSGCHKKAEVDATPVAENPTAPAVAAAITATKAVVNTGSLAAEAEAAILEQLTQAVRKYGMEKQRVPKSLDELVAAGYLTQLPEAPAGKKFVLDARTMDVTLSKR